MPLKDGLDLHSRCSRLVEQANLLAASGNSIWDELPRSVTVELAVELGRVHRNVLGILAWFSNDQSHLTNAVAFSDQLKTYLSEAERFLETLEKAND